MPSPIEIGYIGLTRLGFNVESLPNYIPRIPMGIERDELVVILIGAGLGAIYATIAGVITSLFLDNWRLVPWATCGGAIAGATAGYRAISD